MTMQRETTTPIRWWVPGDWNGFFGLFTNVVLNVIVLTGLCLGVIKLPGDIVFGRILPALGIALPLGNLYYAYLAYRLAQTEKRGDVTAMPYGPSVPHMFIVVFVIMLPVYLKTNNALLAWQEGLAWAFIIGVIVLIGAFIGPTIRRLTPRAAMLGTLAGISIAFISLRPAFQMWEVPWISFISFGIVLMAWTANIRLPGGVPGGLAAVVVGTVIAWIAAILGWTDIVNGPQVFQGYWRNPAANAAAFIEFEGRTFFRTGDLGRMDEEGYFFLTDRLKRMINASGFKVWPAEVESLLYKCPAIQEACIIAARDAYRGETVKAVVVLRADAQGKTTAEDITSWAKEHMAAYKVPRLVEFVDELPKSGTGKVMWRALQEREAAREAAAKP